ncbi:hypothetical protein KKG31_00380 [Patescibacteria group bacterium]|nr:hypothetical protein [Patescibacteria group bacterium]MBU1757646.1 hypothetical protein [Patescibacteria group bacterium]
MSIKRKNVAEEINIPAGIPIVDAKNAEMISDEEILKVAFRCEESGRPYKILKQELDFYKLMKLPIPVFHYDVRYKKRLQQKPTRELHLRKCDKCTTEMVSVYPQDSDFKVYCEVCYNKEIY